MRYNLNIDSERDVHISPFNQSRDALTIGVNTAAQAANAYCFQECET